MRDAAQSLHAGAQLLKRGRFWQVAKRLGKTIRQVRQLVPRGPKRIHQRFCWRVDFIHRSGHITVQGNERICFALRLRLFCCLRCLQRLHAVVQRHVCGVHACNVQGTQGGGVALQFQQLALETGSDFGLLRCGFGCGVERADLRPKCRVVVVQRHFGGGEPGGIQRALCCVGSRGVALGAQQINLQACGV